MRFTHPLVALDCGRNCATAQAVPVSRGGGMIHDTTRNLTTQADMNRASLSGDTGIGVYASGTKTRMAAAMAAEMLASHEFQNESACMTPSLEYCSRAVDRFLGQRVRVGAPLPARFWRRSARCAVVTTSVLATTLGIVPAHAAAVFSYQGAIVQHYVTSITGDYVFTAFGARGGASALARSLGAEVGGTIFLTAGTALNIVVGGAGGDTDSFGASGGGGGTFVYITGQAQPLLVAGGGGGGANGSAGGAGQTSSGAGLGGLGGGDYFGGGGGGGWLGDGGLGENTNGLGGHGGKGYVSDQINAFLGGVGLYAAGGYGGGGGGGGRGGGGGGGYTGGNGGEQYVPGAGGGSYIGLAFSDDMVVSGVAAPDGGYNGYLSILEPTATNVAEPASVPLVAAGIVAMGLASGRSRRRTLRPDSGQL